MPPSADRADWEAQLARSVLKVVCGGTYGTGFVVGPGLVLTCHHVVASGAPIALTGRDGVPYPGSVVAGARGPGWPDLALLAVPADLPAVILDGAPTPRGTEQDLLVAGFPAQATQVPYQTRGFSSGGEQNWGPEGAGPYLRLDGDPVVGGMSGGPVFSLATGFACGIVRLTIDDQQDAGGFAVPMATVLQQLPALRELSDRPGPAAAAWAGLLGAVHLKQQRRDEAGDRFEAPATPRLDLSVAGAGSPLVSWEVSTLGSPARRAQVQVGDLGGELMEALDRWSRRRPLEGRAESALLGTLFGKALLPGPVSALLPSDPGGRALVRIRVAEDDRLTAIPWEYAHGPDRRPLAADPTRAFSRFVDVPGVPVTAKEQLRVLAVTVCPPAVAARLPVRTAPSGRAPALASELITSDLERVVRDRPAIALSAYADVSLDEFDRLLRDEGPWDVVHYVGVGGEFGEEATLDFADGPDVAPAPLATVVDKLAGSRCPLVVMQLLSPPADQPGPALAAMRLLPVLRSGAQALVVGEYTTTALQISRFAGRFYAALAAGEPVEVAVQQARRSLAESPPHLDYMAFGTVTVTTTRDGDVRLVLPGAGGGAPGPVGPRPVTGFGPATPAPRDELSHR